MNKELDNLINLLEVSSKLAEETKTTILFVLNNYLTSLDIITLYDNNIRFDSLNELIEQLKNAHELTIKLKDY